VTPIDGGIFDPKSDPTENISSDDDINDVMDFDSGFSFGKKDAWIIHIPQPDARLLTELKLWLERTTGQIDDPRDGPRLMTQAEREAVDKKTTNQDPR
jgi:hypothetical protein